MHRQSEGREDRAGVDGIRPGRVLGGRLGREGARAVLRAGKKVGADVVRQAGVARAVGAGV